MSINIIVAANSLSYIGKKGELLYKLKEDMKRFKEFTTGHTIIMGHNTFKEIGKALPNRKNVVITTNQEAKYQNVQRYNTLGQALVECFKNKETVFILGGERLFKEGLYYADKVYLTNIQDSKIGDRIFPTSSMECLFHFKSSSEWFEEDGIKFKFEEYVSKY